MNKKQRRAIWRGVRDIRTPLPKLQQKLDDASAYYWQLAVTRKLHETAVRERRFDDANYYARFLHATSRRARALLRGARQEA